MHKPQAGGSCGRRPCTVFFVCLVFFGSPVLLGATGFMPRTRETLPSFPPAHPTPCPTPAPARAPRATRTRRRRPAPAPRCERGSEPGRWRFEIEPVAVPVRTHTHTRKPIPAHTPHSTAHHGTQIREGRAHARTNTRGPRRGASALVGRSYHALGGDSPHEARAASRHPLQTRSACRRRTRSRGETGSCLTSSRPCSSGRRPWR